MAVVVQSESFESRALSLLIFMASCLVSLLLLPNTSPPPFKALPLFVGSEISLH
ncbi:hypothetical protein M430DRAFT_34576 [Amorphotheca resinae ATCC 22711]|uniref:Uncharacterized protein n=1 Tax=Amorphotheca resinae ATCC 22711 TaxID=857342 RepID=A0A2T3B3L0_AMORE|nr:hypothetical protein M430DRAFT_34576 [Amorphotheca resinae ATCC 22711]PSS20232.1 hypothetical protein M430DRAFT_34576 [Amorphotheca resinae ATCC 22711]